MDVELPSGHVIDLEPPKLRRILWEMPHDAWSIAGCCTDDAGKRGCDLSGSDAMAAASWALERLSDDEEAVALARMCALFHQFPSDRLQIHDPIMAWECDCYLAAALNDGGDE